MKKTLIAILLVLMVSVVSIYALDDISIYAGIGFDHRNVFDLNDRANSLDVELGVKTPVGNGFNAYVDMDFRFAGKGAVNNTKYSKKLFGFNVHAGALYGLRFVNNPEWEMYLGGGVAFADTRFDKGKGYFNSFGLGLKIMAAYRINETIAIAVSERPDLYVLTNGSFEVGFGNTITAGALVKF